MSHIRTLFQPPRIDQEEEQARYECMQLIKEGRLDSEHVLTQRDKGVPWSVIRDQP